MSFDLDRLREENPLPEYLARRGVQLRQAGREYKALSPFANEKSPSFTVFPGRDGKWRFHCFSSGQSGDLLDFVMAFDRVSLPEAAEILGGKREERRQLASAEMPKQTFDPYADWEVRLPNGSSPEIEPGKRTPQLVNPKRVDESGVIPTTRYTPTLVHPIRQSDGRLIGYVLRVDIGEGHKITPTILWARNRKTGEECWTHHPLPEPRPIYGLERIRRDRQWLIVEGEKAADAGQTALPMMNVVSWIGGGKAYSRTQWQRAKGASIAIWPDNDDAGLDTVWGYWTPRGDKWTPGLAEILLDAGAGSVKILEIARDEHAKGWDIADAVAEGVELLPFMKARARPVGAREILEHKARSKPGQERQREPQPAAITTQQAEPDQEPEPAPKPRKKAGNVVSFPGASPAISADELHAAGLPNYITDTTGKKSPKAMANYLEALRFEPEFNDVFRWNEFTHEIWLIGRPPWHKGAWTPRRFDEVSDGTKTRAALERLGLSPQKGDIGPAVNTVAHENIVNPVRDWFAALKWDGVRRIEGEGDRKPWLTEYCGAKDTLLNRAYGMRFLISVVARVFEPGCKVDTMLILEGAQNLGKSTLFEKLSTLPSGRYFTDSVKEIGSKDTTLQAVGMLMSEVAELSAVKRGDIDVVKAALSSRIDRIRIPYASAPIDIPRQGVFVGTVNPTGTGYLKDPSGGRRFWSVLVSFVDVERLVADQPQLWAEAVDLYRAGEQWHLTEEESALARVSQQDRMEQDPWGPIIDGLLVGETMTTISEIIEKMVIPRAQQTTLVSNRIANYLRTEGWKPGQQRLRTGKVSRVYMRPSISGGDHVES